MNLKEIFTGDHWSIKLGNKKVETGVLLLGDIALAGQVGDLINRHGATYPFSMLPQTFFRADILSFVLECCLSSRGNPWEPKPVVMRGSANYLDVFPVDLPRVVANVANNHFLDFGEIAALDTLSILQDNGFLSCGAVENCQDYEPLLIDTSAGRVVMLAFAPSAHALPGAPEVNVLSGRDEKALSLVREAKKNADIVIVQLHQGVEYSPYVDYLSWRLSHDFVDMGADCVVCHHAHVIQPIEKYKDAVIFHGIGNFLLDVDLQRYPAASYSLALRLGLSQGKIVHILIEPCRLDSKLQISLLSRKEKSLLARVIRAQSNLMFSRVGLLKNFIYAFCILYSSRLLAVGDMVRRKGIKKAFVYYCGRLKFTSR